VIPALHVGGSPVSQYVEFIAELRARGFEGDISTSYADRTVLATDNSIYQRMPQAVAFPRNAMDVIRVGKLAGEERFAEVTLVPRGGGTGTNGQSLTDGLIVDMSRHMNRILEINVDERWAWVEAGVVKDQLNECAVFSPRVTVARDSVSPMPPSRSVAQEINTAPPKSASDARSAFDRLFKKTD